MVTTRSAPRRTSWRQRVRSWPALPTLLLVPAVIGAADIADWCASLANERYRSIVLDRAERIRPVQRNSPMRYLNISDEEIREVDSAAAEFTGTQWISIGAVVTGCPCEDGDKCTDQVWVQAHRKRGAVGLLLSKVDGHWQVGYVQRWWLQYDKLQEQRYRVKSHAEFAALKQRIDQQLEGFPDCGLDKKALAELRDKELPACLRKSE